MTGYRPIFKRPEDEISKKVEDKVKVELDNRIKSEVEKKINEILDEKERKEKTEKASKIAKAVDVAKAFKGEGDIDKADKEKAEKADKEKAEKERSEKDMLCPTCHTGHVHRIETDKTGMIYKCHGDKCGFEAVMVPRNSDYKCLGCGAPIKKPVEDAIAREMEGCPFCKSKRAARYDWSKLWNVKK